MFVLDIVGVRGNVGRQPGGFLPLRARNDQRAEHQLYLVVSFADGAGNYAFAFVVFAAGGNDIFDLVACALRELLHKLGVCCPYPY